MEYLPELIMVGAVSILAAMSPGPDFAVVVKNALFGSRKSGLFTALGVALGIYVHVAYSLVGIGLIVSQSIILFNFIKYLGAIYLFYLAYHLLREKPGEDLKIDDDKVSQSPFKSFKEGFITNALNPKATLFFLSIFTQVINPETPTPIQLIMGVEISIIAGLWFSLLTILITYKPVRGIFHKVHGVLMKVMGGVLIYLGVKVALDTK